MIEKRPGRRPILKALAASAAAATIAMPRISRAAPQKLVVGKSVDLVQCLLQLGKRRHQILASPFGLADSRPVAPVIVGGNEGVW